MGFTVTANYVTSSNGVKGNVLSITPFTVSSGDSASVQMMDLLLCFVNQLWIQMQNGVGTMRVGK